MSEERYIDYARIFTDAYKQNMSRPIPLREMAVIRSVMPDAMPPLHAEDVFAGRVAEKISESKFPVFFSPQKDGQIGYVMEKKRMQELQKKFPARAAELENMLRFWAKEATSVKIRDGFDEELKEYYFSHLFTLDEYNFMRAKKRGLPLGAGFISGSFDSRVAGVMPNFPSFLPGGLPGLCEKIAFYEKKNGTNDFYKAAHEACDLFRETLERYRVEASELLKKEKDENKRKNLEEVAAMCERLQTSPPATLREALQLICTTVSLTGVVNYGRLDVALGDFLDADLKAGRLTEETATELIMTFFDWIEACGEEYDTRVILGGMGRKNEAAADKFALLAIEAGRRRHSIMPVLTLRFHKKQDPALFDAALTSISEGCIYPTLYNDDACVPGFMESMHLPYEDACDYAPLGCGEVLVASKSIGSPNSTFRYLKALEVVFRNGRDAVTGAQIGVKTGELSELDTYEKFEEAYLRQLDARLRVDAKLHRCQYVETGKQIACVLLSLFTDDCIENGRSMFDHGIRYLGANFEGFGLTNSANGLRVVQKLVYEEKRYTLEDLVRIMDANFEGYEEDRIAFRDVEKFGNGEPSVDQIKLRIENFVNERADFHGRAHGFHYCTVASVNPGGIICGPAVAASCDGRFCGEPFALGNSAQPGTDINGPTALLLSAATVDPRNGGYVTNIHMSRETMCNSRDKVKALFLAYFDMGGLQLNVNCFSRGDLEKALENPEAYRSIIVRVSGYSARFVDLDKITQKHIMERTVY